MQQQRREAADLRRDRLHGSLLLRRQGMRRLELRRARLAGRLECFARQRLHRAQPRRQRRHYRLAERALVVARKKAHQFQPVGRQARRIAAHIEDRFQAIERDIACDVRFDDDAGLASVAERHGDAVAATRARARRQRIIEEPWQRHIQRHPHTGIVPTRQGLRICG